MRHACPGRCGRGGASAGRPRGNGGWSATRGYRVAPSGRQAVLGVQRASHHVFLGAHTRPCPPYPWRGRARMQRACLGRGLGRWHGIAPCRPAHRLGDWLARCLRHCPVPCRAFPRGRAAPCRAVPPRCPAPPRAALSRAAPHRAAPCRAALPRAAPCRPAPRLAALRCAAPRCPCRAAPRVLRTPGVAAIANLLAFTPAGREGGSPRPVRPKPPVARKIRRCHQVRSVGPPTARAAPSAEQASAVRGHSVSPARRRMCAGPGPCAASGRTTSTCAGPFRRPRPRPGRPAPSAG
jgi:hypothetical protein